MHGTSALLYRENHVRDILFLDTVAKLILLLDQSNITEQLGLWWASTWVVNHCRPSWIANHERWPEWYDTKAKYAAPRGIGAGYRKEDKLLAGLKLPKFLDKDGKGTLDNEINFRLDLRIRDNVTANSRLDQDNNFATGGSKEVTITPTIDYFLNNRVNLKFYFDQRRVTPYISSSAPTVNTRAGVQVRISLAQ